MELRSDFQDHFLLNKNRFSDAFGNLKTKRTKQTPKKPSKKRSKKHGARATDGNFFHNKTDCPSAVAGLGETLWIMVLDGFRNAKKL